MIKRRPPIQFKKMPEEKKKLIDKGIDIFPVRLDKGGKERTMLEEAKKILCVDRDSTALKELASIGYNVIHDSKIGEIIPKIAARIKKGLYDDVLLSQEKMQKCNTKEENL